MSRERKAANNNSGRNGEADKRRRKKAAWIALAVVVAAVLIGIIVTVVEHSKKGGSADPTDASGENTATATADTETSTSEAEEDENTSENTSADNTETDENAETESTTDADGNAEDEADTAAEDDRATEENTEKNENKDTEGNAGNTLPEIEGTAALTLSSVYTSSILNPDCGYEYAENVASLEVTNNSDSYLVSATLNAVMSDGTEVQFQIFDLPAGSTAEIFDTENQTLDPDATCTSLVCTSEKYTDGDVLMSGTLEVTASGSDAVLTNTGSTTLKNLTVVYHCNMAGQYFGGASYTITIDSLAAGNSYTLSDSTLMGEVAVVRIYQ